jgi:hypothetical protein
MKFAYLITPSHISVVQGRYQAARLHWYSVAGVEDAIC